MAVDNNDMIYPQLAADLLEWYDRHARALPWRALPGNPPTDAYRVWLSEIMLQQTTVAAVRPYFELFLSRWPNVHALATADEASVMAAWAGLGYYARARNLIACARTVVAEHGGRFPEREDDLRTLPGIGAYTAAAIAAIAFGARAVVVDANVERVTARLFALETPIPAARSQLRALTNTITPNARCGDFAQAMMDLGASLCSVRAPKCLACPLMRHCRGRDQAERYPVKLPKAVRPSRIASIFWTERGDEVLLCTRPPEGLLGGMVALPTGPWTTEDPGLSGAPRPGNWQPVGTLRHVFTHFALEATIFRTETGPDDKAGLWWPINRIETAGMPTLFAKAAAIARKAS